MELSRMKPVEHFPVSLIKEAAAHPAEYELLRAKEETHRIVPIDLTCV